MNRLFTATDAWSGGAYELALLYRSGSLVSAIAALRAIWSAPSVGACYPRCDVEPEQQRAVAPLGLSGVDHLYGTCLLGDAVPVLVRSAVIPYEHGPVWVYFGSPMSSLRSAYPTGAYPFDDGSPLEWRAAVDQCLRDIARHVFAQAPFDCALLAHEPEESVAEELDPQAIPERRWEGILLPRGAALEWLPPTERFPFTW